MAYSWSDLTFRQCYRCGYESDDLEEFVSDSRYTYGKKNLCKWCSNHNIAHNNTVRGRRMDMRAYIDTFKRVPCADCGNTFPEVCMDFHHIDPATKTFSLYQVAGRNYTKETVDAEIAKCIVLCANCHRLRTHAERRYKYASDDMHEGGVSGL